MSGWPSMRLDQCCEIVSGATPSTAIPDYWDGDIHWATPKDLSNLEGPLIATTPRRITRSGLASCGASILPIGSVLFSSRAPIGHVAINSVPMATNQGFKSMVPDKRVLEAPYLFHWLKAHRLYLEDLGNGATFKEVSKAVVARVEVPVPSILEQRRIATILDGADVLRVKRRAALAHLNEMTQAIFVEMFGDPSETFERWKSTDLKSVISPGDNINYGVIQPGDDHPGGIGLIRVSDISEGRVNKRNLKSISPEVDQEYKRSRLIGDEVLLSCVGSVGQLALATPDEAGLNIARAIARIRVAPDLIRREFLIAYLNTNYVQEYFKKELRTVSQPTLNIKQIGETPTWLPPLSRQNNFVKAMLTQEKLKLTMRCMLQETEALFASLQHRAFTGAL